jgi:hypothetical protein
VALFVAPFVFIEKENEMTTIIECNRDLVRPKRLLRESTPKSAIEHLINRPVEACSEYSGSVIRADYHAFFSALHAAFVDHRPIVLSPDMIWLLIAQGFANHVNEHAEEMRSHFVSHEGKKTLVVIRDDFNKGSLENPWENVFDEFSTHIRREIGDTNHELIVSQFSTTGVIEKAVNEVVLMDSMKAYFEYIVRTRCGIPEVRLEGTHEDWVQLAKKTEKLGNAFELQWWTERMLPILETIADHSKGQGDPAFWRNIYKWEDHSGGPHIHGWVITFIPYISTDQGMCKASLVFGLKEFPPPWITTQFLPSGLSKVPFIWDYLGNEYEMEFVAGFTSFTQDRDTFAVRPKIGWAVR